MIFVTDPEIICEHSVICFYIRVCPLPEAGIDQLVGEHAVSACQLTAERSVIDDTRSAGRAVCLQNGSLYLTGSVLPRCS